MVGYIVPYMEPPTSPSTIMDSTTVGAAEGARPTVVEAAEGRLHIGGWRDWWFHIWHNISHHIWLQNYSEIDNSSGSALIWGVRGANLA